MLGRGTGVTGRGAAAAGGVEGPGVEEPAEEDELEELGGAYQALKKSVGRTKRSCSATEPLIEAGK